MSSRDSGQYQRKRNPDHSASIVTPTPFSVINYTHVFDSSLSFLKLKKKFILALLGLCCCMWALCSCGEWGLLSSCGVWASHNSGFSCCRAWALDVQVSVVAAPRLSSCAAWAQLLPSIPSCFPDQGSNPCPQHWQVDSCPLYHQGNSPSFLTDL